MARLYDNENNDNEDAYLTMNDLVDRLCDPAVEELKDTGTFLEILNKLKQANYIESPSASALIRLNPNLFADGPPSITYKISTDGKLQFRKQVIIPIKKKIEELDESQVPLSKKISSAAADIVNILRNTDAVNMGAKIIELCLTRVGDVLEFLQGVVF